MTAFFTRIEINPRRRASARVLASPHRLHGAVGTCFPPSRRPTRPLWRVDHTPAGTVLYLVSDVAPDPTGFVEEHGWPAAGGWQTRDYTPVLHAVRDGAAFEFRVAVNPVRNVTAPGPDGEPGRGRGIRMAHVTAAQQAAWFASRSSDWGFSVGDPDAPTFRIVERRVLEFPRGGATVTIGMAVIEGTLTVTQPDDLRARLLDGIGPAKAYGCGLLTLAPLRS